MEKKGEQEPMKGKLILYQTEDGKTKVEVKLQDETVWLSQRPIAELFQKDVRTINEHIKNIFAEGELLPESVIRNLRITAPMREKRGTGGLADAAKASQTENGTGCYKLRCIGRCGEVGV